ncbi:hypothetical protein F442_20737 [Phytophthora nicotianae P10297]|uniref:Chitin-binding type-4 domain-containing protein n=1 Tax=Phytophthora nicotianae P10297 TaxID=1317064 RepID=W2Y686_PHYNI|nr:hypothetical protein F442_20737 [Phytophthora nicotianae P10297]
MKTFVFSSAIVLATLVGSVNAHGYISRPKASYKPNTAYTKYNGVTSASVNKGFAGGVYNHEPVNNAKQFAEHWKATGYKSLRDMIDPISPGYGYSLDTAPPVDVSGYKETWWQNDEYKEGFLESHHGPCEGWIDDTKVFHYDDCVAEFPSYPAKIPTDYSACKGDKCLFVFYWLALHSPKWQIYKQCVPISNGGSGEVAGEALTTDQTTPEAAPAAPEATPAALTTGFTKIDSTPAPADTPPTVTSNETPGTGTSSCKRRMRS